MKVKELIERLLKVDPEMIVYCTSNTGEYKYGVDDVLQVSVNI